MHSKDIAEIIIIDETHYGSHSGVYGKAIGFANDEETKKEYSQAEIDEMKKDLVEIKKLNNAISNIGAKYRIQCSGTPYYILSSGEFAEMYTNKEIISDISFTDMINARNQWVKDNPGEDESNSPYYGIPDIHRFGLKLTKKCMKDMVAANVNPSLSKLFSNDSKHFYFEDAIIDLMESIFGAHGKDLPGFLDTKKIKEGEKENISSMKTYNPNEEW